MGLIDKAKDMKDDALDQDARDKIQRIATEHGMSYEEAKTYYLRTKDDA